VVGFGHHLSSPDQPKGWAGGVRGHFYTGKSADLDAAKQIHIKMAQKAEPGGRSGVQQLNNKLKGPSI